MPSIEDRALYALAERVKTESRDPLAVSLARAVLARRTEPASVKESFRFGDTYDEDAKKSAQKTA